MKLLLVINAGFRVTGGAALASVSLLRRLRREFGHEGVLVSPHFEARRERRDGVELIAYRDLQELVDLARRDRPDVVVGALRASVDAMRVAERFGLPGVLCLHDYDLCEPTALEKGAWGIPETVPFPSAAEVDFTLRRADRIFACSQHMRDVLAAKRKVASEVLYSEWDRAELVLERTVPGRAEFITGLCGYRHKGLDVFLHLARAFPGERFLLVGDPQTDIALSYRRALAETPNLTLAGALTPAEFLAQSRVVVVPSQWPEPFGRVAVEALANGVPTLVSAAGGLAEIVGRGPMAVEAFRDPDEWTRRLGALLESAELRRAYAAQGPALVARFLEPATTRRFAEAVEALAAARRPTPDRRLIAFEGERGRIESFSMINTVWSRELAARADDCRDYGEDPFTLPDAVIHHNYARNFLEFSFPDTGKVVAVRSWDFGPFPRDIVEEINAKYDQLWLYSRWIERLALESGIDPRLVRRVPPGIDPSVFRPDGDPYLLPGGKGFAFLFVGGTVVRKGIDILLAAYRQAFSAADDVCLVIKDSRENRFFAGQTYHEDVERLVRDARGPAVVYIDRHLSETELAALYRACDVAVFPYRAEGFVLPILEAMACGTPPIAPRLGPCLDFCGDETAFLVPALRVRLPVRGRMRLGSGVEYDLDGVDFCEIRVETLAEHLRGAYEAPAERRAALARAGVSVAHGQFTWEHSVAAVERCLRELEDGEPPRRLARARLEQGKAGRRLDAARRLITGHAGSPRPR